MTDAYGNTIGQPAHAGDFSSGSINSELGNQSVPPLIGMDSNGQRQIHRQPMGAGDGSGSQLSPETNNWVKSNPQPQWTPQGQPYNPQGHPQVHPQVPPQWTPQTQTQLQGQPNYNPQGQPSMFNPSQNVPPIQAPQEQNVFSHLKVVPTNQPNIFPSQEQPQYNPQGQGQPQRQPQGQGQGYPQVQQQAMEKEIEQRVNAKMQDQKFKQKEELNQQLNITERVLKGVWKDDFDQNISKITKYVQSQTPNLGNQRQWEEQLKSNLQDVLKNHTYTETLLQNIMVGEMGQGQPQTNSPHGQVMHSQKGQANNNTLKNNLEQEWALLMQTGSQLYSQNPMERNVAQKRKDQIDLKLFEMSKLEPSRGPQGLPKIGFLEGIA